MRTLPKSCLYRTDDNLFILVIVAIPAPYK